MILFLTKSTHQLTACFQELQIDHIQHRNALPTSFHELSQQLQYSNQLISSHLMISFHSKNSLVHQRIIILYSTSDLMDIDRTNSFILFTSHSQLSHHDDHYHCHQFYQSSKDFRFIPKTKTDSTSRLCENQILFYFFQSLPFLTE
jgi:hypothetical protein